MGKDEPGRAEEVEDGRDGKQVEMENRWRKVETKDKMRRYADGQMQEERRYSRLGKEMKSTTREKLKKENEETGRQERK